MLKLVKNLTAQKEISCLADCFVQAVHQKATSCHLNIYFFDHRNSELCFLTSSSVEETWPKMDMGELENPLVYAARNQQPCFVENISHLIDVGSSFECYKQLVSYGSALVALPILAEKRQLLGLVVMHGPFADVDAWLKSQESIDLREIFIDLFALVFLYEKNIEQLKSEQSYLSADLTRKVKDQAKHFIEAEFVGRSQAAEKVRSEVLNLSDSSLSVLLTGETGTGKDYIASLLHKMSSRKGEFVAVNCAAIAKDLIESELFGSVKGAFTGAQNRQGLVAAAHHGTLFLDEIGDMPLPLQASLLRLLNEKKYRPVGSSKEHVSDFRLICATNKPLLKMVENGEFREDLYYRICQSQMELPPLRQRLVDMGALSRWFIEQYNQIHSNMIRGITSEAIDTLRSHSFMGNVRELKNIIFVACERTSALEMVSQETILQCLPILSKTDASLKDKEDVMLDAEGINYLWQTTDLPLALEKLEEEIIRARLELMKGSKMLTAQSLGIPQRTFVRKCQHWNL